MVPFYYSISGRIFMYYVVPLLDLRIRRKITIPGRFWKGSPLCIFYNSISWKRYYHFDCIPLISPLKKCLTYFICIYSWEEFTLHCEFHGSLLILKQFRLGQACHANWGLQVFIRIIFYSFSLHLKLYILTISVETIYSFHQPKRFRVINKRYLGKLFIWRVVLR